MLGLLGSVENENYGVARWANLIFKMTVFNTTI